MKIRKIILFCILFIVFVGCTKEKDVNQSAIDDLRGLPELWEETDKHVFHQERKDSYRKILGSMDINFKNKQIVYDSTYDSGETYYHIEYNWKDGIMYASGSLYDMKEESESCKYAVEFKTYKMVSSENCPNDYDGRGLVDTFKSHLDSAFKGTKISIHYLK